MLDRADCIARGDVPAESQRPEGDQRRGHGPFEQRLERLADSHPSAARYTQLEHRTGRRGQGWEALDARDHPDQPARADTHLSADRARHVLEGDGPGELGGGHRHGTGKPDKTEFPKDWSDQTIVSFVEDVSRRPDEVRWQDNKRWHVKGERDGVNVNAVILPDGRIWTAWPDEGGRGVRQNPPEA